jgi:hypothetical protein
MNFGRLALTLAAATLTLAPAAAFADGRGWHHHDRDYGHGYYGQGYYGRGYEVVVPPAPPLGFHRSGYEVRPGSRWIEGRWVRDWVPGECFDTGRFRHEVRCSEGRYVDRWQPGYYEQVDGWVSRRW